MNSVHYLLRTNSRHLSNQLMKKVEHLEVKDITYIELKGSCLLDVWTE